MDALVYAWLGLLVWDWSEKSDEHWIMSVIAKIASVILGVNAMILIIQEMAAMLG